MSVLITHRAKYGDKQQICIYILKRLHWKSMMKVLKASSHLWLSTLQTGRCWACLLAESYQPNQLQPDPAEKRSPWFLPGKPEKHIWLDGFLHVEQVKLREKLTHLNIGAQKKTVLGPRIKTGKWAIIDVLALANKQYIKTQLKLTICFDFNHETKQLCLNAWLEGSLRQDQSSHQGICVTDTWMLQFVQDNGNKPT